MYVSVLHGTFKYLQPFQEGSLEYTKQHLLEIESRYCMLCSIVVSTPYQSSFMAVGYWKRSGDWVAMLGWRVSSTNSHWCTRKLVTSH